MQSSDLDHAPTSLVALTGSDDFYETTGYGSSRRVVFKRDNVAAIYQQERTVTCDGKAVRPGRTVAATTVELKNHRAESDAFCVNADFDHILRWWKGA